MDGLENQIEGSDFTDPKELETILKGAYSSLLHILETMQAKPPDDRGTAQAGGNINDRIQHILNVLETSQDKLKASEASLDRYRAIVESQTELICRFRPDGTLTFFNEAYRLCFANFGQVKIGQNALALLPNHQRQLVKDHLSLINKSKPVVSLEFPLPIPGGETCWLHWTGVGNFDLLGQVVEVQIVGRDITNRKQGETAAERFASRKLDP